ncbi:MAG: tetratricopeptide repeat protein [Polyangiaceae bacterium]|nr:tetratricopeptide repeat protein [Polyangiaceae bacterium]MCE7888416.1 tetratricopeptide repeat protein [Sorangiineae bacterium PRO1]MCL4755645.1 tetratricopeptide repeat protein [Myxococcales bacterium]
MTQTLPGPADPEKPAPVPHALRALHARALGAFAAGRYRRALPLLGRLVLALPVGNSLRPTVRGCLARAFIELGNVAAARRELGHALAAEPQNSTFRTVQKLLRRAERERPL